VTNSLCSWVRSGRFLPYLLHDGATPVESRKVQTARRLCLGSSGSMVPWSRPALTLGGVRMPRSTIQGLLQYLCDTFPDPAEYACRNQSGHSLIQHNFAEAKARKSASVMLISQADPGFELDGHPRGGTTRDRKRRRNRRSSDGFRIPGGFAGLRLWRVERPVAYVHGRLARFRTDKPVSERIGANAGETSRGWRDVR